ncbi:MAG: hypothetical protein ABIE74_12790 [Pseudomonadota bacterium]
MKLISPENYAEGFKSSEINFYNDSYFGSGEFITTILGQIFLTNKAANNIIFNPPNFQITLKVDPILMKVFVLLARIDDTAPLSMKQFIIPSGLDLTQNFTFKIKFLNWKIEQAWINAVPLEQINNFFDVSPIFKGSITPRDFLRNDISSQGTGFSFWAKLPINGIIFRLAYKNYIFQLFGESQQLILQRNDDKIVISSNELKNTISPLLLGLYWRPDLIALHAIVDGVQIKKEKNTLSTTPPFELLDILAKEQQLQIIEYDSEENFRQKLHLLLQSLQDNINQLARIKIFYRDDGVTPKEEPQVVATLVAFLKSSAELAGIKISVENKTGRGDLDVKFSANIKGIGIKSVHCEFKHAHSEKLDHGFVKQLPTYMLSERVQYGIYCVLWFKGKKFNNPKHYNNVTEIVSTLRQKATTLGLAEEWLDRIRVMGVDLSLKPPASQI